MIFSPDYYVAPINSSIAYRFTSAYHYSGVGFKKAKVNQGIFRISDDLLVGVLQWGVSAQEGIKLDRYVKEPIDKSQYLELNRFCMADSEGKNAESQAISIGIKWIKQNMPEIKLLVSYAGRKEGNYGYIYQATSWTYLGYFVSSGFWLINGRERHQLTLWHTYKHDCDTNLSFRDALCQKFDDVAQTWTKQFIYVKLLDKKLHYASELERYPKATNEYPICTKTEWYKTSKGAYSYDKPKAPVYYYKEPETRLFTLATLKRNGQYKRKLLAIYDKDGKYLEMAISVTDASMKCVGVSRDMIRTSLKTEKPANGYLFKEYYDGDEIPKLEILKYICIIDGEKFYSLQSAADHCGTVRQTIYEAKKRHAKKICGRAVEWRE